MLSAVAARKAAQAQKAAQLQAQVQEVDTSPLPPHFLAKNPAKRSNTSAKGRKNDIPEPSSDEDSENELPDNRAVDGIRTPGGAKRKRGRKTRYFNQPPLSAEDIAAPMDVEMFPAVQEAVSGDFNNVEIIRSKRAWSPSNPAPLSSAEESEEDETPPHQPPQKNSTSVSIPLPEYTTWNPTQANCFDLPSTTSSISRLLLLRPQEAVTLSGTFTLQVLRGRVVYQGATISPREGTLSIFAPKCSPLGRIEAFDTPEYNPSLDVLPAPLQKTVSNHRGAAIVISDLATGVEVTGRVFPVFKDAFTLSRAKNDPAWTTTSIVRDGHSSLYPHIIPPSWEQATNSAIKPPDDSSSVLRSPVFLTRGPKGSGKSSFSQLLINRLLQRYHRVALLDTDPGQPLMSPPSLISLHIFTSPFFGPSFVNSRIPARAHFLGSVNLRTCTEQWIEGVEDLLRTWRLDYSFSSSDSDHLYGSDPRREDRIDGIVPLVINTPGWTKGYGSVLLRQLTEMAEPSHLFAFPETPNTDPFAPPQLEEYFLPPESTGRIFNLNPIPPTPLTLRYSSADFRIVSLLSYLHARLPPPSPNLNTNGAGIQCTQWESTKSLISMEPWAVSYNFANEGGAIDRVYLCGPWAGDVVASEIARVMDCAIVGLVEADPQSIESMPLPDGDSEPPATATTGIPYIQASPPPLASSSTCIGLGLIRAVDTSTQNFHLLTPLPAAVLPGCRVLIKGEVELPVWGFLNFGEDPSILLGLGSGVGSGENGVGEGSVPYLDWGSTKGVAGGEKRRVRRNVMRKGQM